MKKFLDSQSQMSDHLDKVLYTKAQVEKRIQEIGQQITQDYQDKKPLMIGILKGGTSFSVHLVEAMNLYCQLDFIDVKSYARGRLSSTGKVRLVSKPEASLKGRNVIFCDDIVDTGRTAAYARQHAKAQGAKSFAMASLLDKPKRRVCDIKPNYCGFKVPNVWIVGYGMNYKGIFRNLPEIATLKPNVYQEY